MTNYRRLISYIYAYEGEVKGKNIGFAKLESRNGQWQTQRKCKEGFTLEAATWGFICWPREKKFFWAVYLSAAAAVSSVPW